MTFSRKVLKKDELLIPVFLHEGSWGEFKLCLIRGGYANKGWDSNISRKIFMILHGEEIRERFLSAFPPLSRFEKLDLSLDDIINPIEVLEKKSHRKGCHPGRLTLDPERYNRAWGANRHGDSEFLRYPPGQETPPHMRAGFLATPWGKHRLLDVSEDIENPHRRALEHGRTTAGFQQKHLSWGLQDMYFLGGIPLEYWCNGPSMGIKVPTGLPCSETYQWPGGTAFRAQTDEEAGCGDDFSSMTECRRTYCFSRMWYLPTEVSWRHGREMAGTLFIDLYERVPRTWRGNAWWTTGRGGLLRGVDLAGQDHDHFVYIKYIQEIEDFDEAVKWRSQRSWSWSRRLEDDRLRAVRNFSRRTVQEVTLWGSPELPPT